MYFWFQKHARIGKVDFMKMSLSSTRGAHSHEFRPPKSSQKSVENYLNIQLNRRQNIAKSKSEGGLGLLGGVSSPQGDCRPFPGRLLGSSWAILGASWAPLVQLLSRLRHQAGASWGVLEASWRRLGGNLMPKWRQVGSTSDNSWILF